MARRLKVYGGMRMITGRGIYAQRRCIIAATSMAEARRITGMTRSETDDYWCETGNPEELAAATARPGVLLIDRGGGKYVTKDEWHL